MIIESFEWLLHFNLELSLLLASVVALRWLLKKTARLYNIYWLWLLLPLVPLLGFVATSIPASQQALIVEQLNSIQEDFGASFFSSADAIITLDSRSFASKPLSNNLEPIQSTTSYMAFFAGIWLVGALFFLGRLLRQHHSLRQQLANSCSPIEINNNLDNSKTAYPIIGVDIDGFSPAVYGFFKPKIYFPKGLYGQLSSQQRLLILEHEEQHILQGHLWLNFLWDIAASINWFNPLLYVAKRLFRHDQEVHCDSLVLKKHDKPRQQAYGHALLSTVSATHSVSPLCSWKMFDQLEERIMNIKNRHPKTKLAILASAMAGALTLSSLYAIASENEVGNAKAIRKVKVIDLSPDFEASDEEKAASSISIVSIDNDGDKEIVMKTNGKTYRMENGELFVEENGERRAMSELESKEMDQLLDKSERYSKATDKDRRDIFEQENVYAYSFDTDEPNIDIAQIEIELLDKIASARLNADQARAKIFAIMNDADDYELRIKSALDKVRASDDPAVKTAIRGLEKAQKQLEQSRERMQQQQQKAFEKLKELEKMSPIESKAKKG